MTDNLTCSACRSANDVTIAASGNPYCAECRESIVVNSSEDFAYRQIARKRAEQSPPGIAAA